MPQDRYAELRGFQPVGRRPTEPVSIGKILPELIALKGLARVEGIAQLQQAWKTTAGVRLADSTRVIGLNRGVLQVGVNNTALLSELAGFHKQTLLANLQNQHPHLKIKDLKFRLKTDLKR